MAVLYGNQYIPLRIDSFSLKVRVLIDQRDVVAANQNSPRSNVIQFPSSAKRAEKAASQVYLEACQQLLRPVRYYFYEDQDDGGEGGSGIHALNSYLGELKQIEGQYINEAEGEAVLDSAEREHLQADVANLQAAGFEHAAELHPEIIAAYGDQLAERHLPANYQELAQNKDVAYEMKKAYADVKGMIEQAKQSVRHITQPTLTRR